MRRVLLSLLGVLVLGACATTLQTGVDFNHAVSFTGYRSFAWMPRTHADIRNPLNVGRVQDAIRAELEAKGLRFEPDLAQADLAVDFTLGSAERIDVTSYPAEFRGGWGWGGGYWGAGYWGSDIDVHQYREGTLSIDFFDARSHQPLWHGWATKPLERKDLDNPGPPIRAAVAAVLAPYPPGPPPAAH
jgi:hypothetical protein